MIGLEAAWNEYGDEVVLSTTSGKSKKLDDEVVLSMQRKSGKSIYLSVNKKTNKPIPAIIITHN